MRMQAMETNDTVRLFVFFFGLKKHSTEAIIATKTQEKKDNQVKEEAKRS